MKKYALLGILAMTAAAPAYAAPMGDGYFFKPYVGADYQLDHLSNADNGGVSVGQVYKDNLSGGDVHIGARMSRYFGAELGYERTENGEKTNVLGSGVNTKVRQSGGTFDVLGYLPVSNSVDLIGTLGVGVVDTHASASSGYDNTSTDVKGRGGLGAQWWLTDSVNVRGIVRYEGVNFDSNDARDSVLASAGVNFSF